MLKPLVKNWVPEAFVVSFKLETDINLLKAKSQRALKTYDHEVRNSEWPDEFKKTWLQFEEKSGSFQILVTMIFKAVVGNILEERKKWVVIYYKDNDEESR